ncbi:MAG: hypothetical protein HY921_07540 [Elusimicrobia bacterium]|nr:hypothetical protein [Elusimicrobiota bacterium]
MERLILILIILAGLACSGKDQIAVYDAPKEAGEAALPDPSEPAPSWKVPEGWKQKPSLGLRLASFSIPHPAGEAELSIVVLSGEAGGELANVNRWRGQMGLAPLSAEELPKSSRRFSCPAGEVLIAEISSPTQGRLAAARLYAGGRSWFFKLSGPEASVAAALPAFEAFLGSLRLGGA